MPLPAGSKAARTSPPSRSTTSRSVSVRPVPSSTRRSATTRSACGAWQAAQETAPRCSVAFGSHAGVERRGGRVAADAGRADQFGAGAALHVVGAVAIRAERGVEVIAGRAGLAVHAPGVGRENLRVAGAARRAGERREPLLRRHLVGAVAVGAARRALGPGAQQREVDAPLGLAQLVGVAAGAGADGRDGAVAARRRRAGGVRARREPGVAVGAVVVRVHGGLELGRVDREFHRRAVRALQRQGAGVAGQAVLVGRDAASSRRRRFSPRGSRDTRRTRAAGPRRRRRRAGSGRADARPDGTRGRRARRRGDTRPDSPSCRPSGWASSFTPGWQARHSTAAVGRTGEIGGRHRQGELLALRRGQGKPGILVARETRPPRRPGGGGGSRRAGKHRRGGEQQSARTSPCRRGNRPPCLSPFIVVMTAGSSCASRSVTSCRAPGASRSARSCRRRRTGRRRCTPSR